jgi:hypothetical protein
MPGRARDPAAVARFGEFLDQFCLGDRVGVSFGVVGRPVVA